MRNSKEIELFGLNLKLFERNAADVLALEEYKPTNTNGDIGISDFHAGVQMVSDSLKYNLHDMKPWQIFRNWTICLQWRAKWLLYLKTKIAD